MNNLLSRRACVLLALVTLVSCPACLRAEEPKNTSPRVAFLDVEAARAAIVDDSADRYFERLTATEMTVKTGRPIAGGTADEQRKECKARYQAACEAFTDEERKAVSAIVADLEPRLRRELPRFADQPWSFIKVKGTLEGGMPHTRGPHIVLPAPMLGFLARFGGDAGPAAAQLSGIFVHEQTHVIERAHPEWFDKLYTDVLGFQKAKHIEPDAWVTARHIVNPDGTDVTWVMPIKADDGKTRWVWPLILLADPKATSFRSMQKVAIDVEPDAGGEGRFKVKLDADGVPVHSPLDSVKPYAKAVLTRQSSYHPNEIAADLMARLVTDARAAEDGSLKSVRTWAREAFKSPAPAAE